MRCCLKTAVNVFLHSTGTFNKRVMKLLAKLSSMKNGKVRQNKRIQEIGTMMRVGSVYVAQWCGLCRIDMSYLDIKSVYAV